ncbi:MAG: ParB/RepB/Spo0J family partition protein [Candidatus Peribacteraceae bacterium]|nr:ParB/RepB/Spo0J family partition protein [Candidatus Peribacteraceae bacterium]
MSAHTKKELLGLKPDQLLTHPRNMRRFYPAESVREMANSIAASNGVIEPLIVTKDPAGQKWLVVDGNMRLAGARLLGNKCPPLDCKLVEQAAADQLLTMVIANQVRYDVDPVSEGLHYKALQEAEGLSIREISKRTGVYEVRISNRRVLADLDEPIQKLIADGKLHADPRVARALLQLTPAVRVKLACRLAENPNIKIATIVNACERLLEDKKPAKKLKRPAVELSGALHASGAAAAKSIRAAAKEMCHRCNQVEDKLREGDEPAWSMVVHAADDNCSHCPLKDMQKICSQCPAVTLLRRLVDSKGNGNGR